MYKLVPKRIIKRVENTNENEEFRMMKLTLELAKESDDELWRELILLHLDDMKILNSKDKEKIKKKFEGNLQCTMLIMKYTNTSMSRPTNI